MLNKCENYNLHCHPGSHKSLHVVDPLVDEDDFSNIWFFLFDRLVMDGVDI